METTSAHIAPMPAETTVTAVDIPQEVADLIVDVISHDFTSLKLCSLISQQWRPRSQYHLHRKLRINRSTDLRLLASVYSDPLIASYVRTLDIKTMWDPFWESVLPVLEKLDSVRNLTLDSLGDINTVMQRFVVGRFVCLDSLTLSFVTFQNFTSLSDFLNALPALSRLDMNNVYWTRSESPPSRASIHRFRQLRIAFCSEQHMLVRWLMDAGENLKLESLTLTWYSASDIVREFMRFLGEHLLHFSFSYVFSDESWRDWKDHPLDLSPNTNLRSLEFMTNVMIPYTWGSLPTIPEMLSSVTSPLHTLSVHVANLDEEPVPLECLSSIDGILDDVRFRSLSRVNMYTDVSISPEHGRDRFVEVVRSAVQSAMPKMFRKGILHVGPSE